jgi:hypothetical protein
MGGTVLDRIREINRIFAGRHFAQRAEEDWQRKAREGG